MPKSIRVFFETTYVVKVYHKDYEPCHDETPMSEIVRDIEQSNLIGNFEMGKKRVLSGKQMVNALKRIHVSPDRFGLKWNGDDKKPIESK